MISINISAEEEMLNGTQMEARLMRVKEVV